MSSFIKKLFDKKKVEAKFKLAGPGHKLGDAQAHAASNQARVAALNASSESRKALVGGGSRAALTPEQRQAATAALQRFDQSSSASEDFDKKRSRAAIRAMAQKELDEERQITAEAAKLKAAYGDKPAVPLEGPPLLGCEGVFFQCPLITPEVLPKKEMQKAIRDFLYAELETGEDKGLTACLIIHTLNKASEVRTCVETLCKYFDNILNHPDEEKYRKIRKTNKAYLERVVPVEGHDALLRASGFETVVVDDEEFWIFTGAGDDVDRLRSLREAVESAEPIQAELNRGLKILLPREASKRVELPLDFFNISPEELEREQRCRAEAVEKQGMLRTKTMREREEIREKRNYKYTLIRIRFPDGFILQGTFSVYETFSKVIEFVAESLEHLLPFVLYDISNQMEIHDCGLKTLVDLKLVPSAMLTFSWHPGVAEEIEQQISTMEGQGRQAVPYLRIDLMEKFFGEPSGAAEK